MDMCKQDTTTTYPLFISTETFYTSCLQRPKSGAWFSWKTTIIKQRGQHTLSSYFRQLTTFFHNPSYSCKHCSRYTACKIHSIMAKWDRPFKICTEAIHNAMSVASFWTPKELDVQEKCYQKGMRKKTTFFIVVHEKLVEGAFCL